MTRITTSVEIHDDAHYLEYIGKNRIFGTV